MSLSSKTQDLSKYYLVEAIKEADRQVKTTTGKGILACWPENRMAVLRRIMARFIEGPNPYHE